MAASTANNQNLRSDIKTNKIFKQRDQELRTKLEEAQKNRNVMEEELQDRMRRKKQDTDDKIIELKQEASRTDKDKKESQQEKKTVQKIAWGIKIK